MDSEVYWKAIHFIESLDRRYADTQKVGWLYAVRNQEFVRPLYKVGMTQRAPHERAQELASTGVPGRFELVYCVHAFNARLAESIAHEMLARYRFEPGKEFFEAPVGVIVAILDRAVAGMPIRNSLVRSGYNSERSKPLAQPFKPLAVTCGSCGQTNRVRPLAIAVTPTCGKCSTPLSKIGGLATPKVT